MIILKNIYNEIFDANLLEQKSKFIIYCDMDGVLCDFDKMFKSLSNFPASSIPTPSMWKIINSQGHGFWSNMSPTKDFNKLKTGLTSLADDHQLRLVFLTSTGEEEIYKNYKPNIAASITKEVKEGKNKWLQKHWGSNYRVIFATSGKNKSLYAVKNSVLIDDLPNNVQEFMNKGGFGILHKNADLTLSRLRSILSHI